MSEAEIATLAAYVADWWTERLQQGNQEAFNASLRASVDAALRERPWLRLTCDYDPQGPLLEAVRAAGLKCDGFLFSARGILPQKHDLYIYPARAAEPEFEQEAAPARLVTKEGYGNWNEPIPLSEIFGALKEDADT